MPRQSPITITTTMVKRMIEMKAQGASFRRIGRALGINERNVRRHLPPCPEKRTVSKLNKSEIFYDVACGAKAPILAMEHGVHPVYMRKFIAKHRAEELPKARVRVFNDIRQAYQDGDVPESIREWSRLPKSKFYRLVKDLPKHTHKKLAA